MRTFGLVAAGRFGLACGLAGSLLLAAAAPATALGPDSPPVRRLVQRGLEWLATQTDDRLGGECLIGLAFLKAGQPASHPKVRQALQACQLARLQDADAVDNYSVGLAAIFLLELDPRGQRPLIERYLAEIVRRQKPHGAWGYPNSEQGDTSQTQYPLLALWLAGRHNVPVSPNVIERACLWLLRTQDPSGGWGYQGEMAPLGQRRPQSEVRESLVAAAMGSLYVCGDLLALRSMPDQPTGEEALPAALRPVGQREPAPRPPPRAAIDRRLYQQAMDDGHRWLGRNYTVTSQGGYTFYYLYAWERYHSFRELAEKRVDPDPRWYNDMVAYLQREEQSSGGWRGENEGASVATAFAILALVRNMQKTLQQTAARAAEGLLVGGIGLPPQTADLKEMDGRLFTPAGVATLDELLAELKKAEGPRLDVLLHAAGRAKLSEEVTRRSGQIAQLQALVQRGTPAERLAAVRVLGRQRDLEVVPLLILALDDPDGQVVQEADRALRYVSGKFEGVGLPENPQPAELQAAKTAWKQWYLGLRPGGRLLN
jgi:hypothetical protein